MTKTATVIEIIDDDTALICTHRESACGENCANCKLTDAATTLNVHAHNKIGAVVGDTVEVFTNTSLILKTAAKLYLILPGALLVLAIIGTIFKLFESKHSAVITFCCAIVFIACAIIEFRRRPPSVNYEITKITHRLIQD